MIVGGEELHQSGHENSKEDQNDIFVLDIQNENQYKLWGTSLRIPRNDKYASIDGAVGTRDSGTILLTSGWIRSLFATETFAEMELPPAAIIQMIENYKNVEETIHWFLTENTYDDETGEVVLIEENHYAMPLSHILSSMSEKAHQVEVDGINYWTDVRK